MNTAIRSMLCLVAAAFWTGCNDGTKATQSAAVGEVVVYTSVDRVFSEPVLQAAGRQLGFKVIGVYDTEETKSTGLVNRLLARKEHPDGDLFWSGDPGRAALLKSKGITAPYASPAGAAIRAQYKDADNHWTGFSARARTLIVNNDLVKPGEEPKSLEELTQPQWQGRVAMASPLFGTTSYHVAALFEAWGDDKAWEWLQAMKRNGLQVVSSNGEAKRQVAMGQAAVGLTDTDDVSEAIKDKQPVRAVFLNQAADSGQPLGNLVIPNTVSLIAGGPNRAGAEKVYDFLLSPAIQSMLAASCAQAPLTPGVPAPPGILPLDTVKAMRVDYGKVADRLDALLPRFKEWVDAP